MDHKDPLLSRVIYTNDKGVKIYGPTGLGWLVLVVLAPVLLKITFVLADVMR